MVVGHVAVDPPPPTEECRGGEIEGRMRSMSPRAREVAQVGGRANARAAGRRRRSRRGRRRERGSRRRLQPADDDGADFLAQLAPARSTRSTQDPRRTAQRGAGRVADVVVSRRHFALEVRKTDGRRREGGQGEGPAGRDSSTPQLDRRSTTFDGRRFGMTTVTAATRKIRDGNIDVLPRRPTLTRTWRDQPTALDDDAAASIDPSARGAPRVAGSAAARRRPRRRVADRASGRVAAEVESSKHAARADASKPDGRRRGVTAPRRGHVSMDAAARTARLPRADDGTRMREAINRARRCRRAAGLRHRSRTTGWWACPSLWALRSP